jgi:CheY-like chemotaxis protein
MTDPITVLIVDDDPSIRFLTKHALNNYDSGIPFVIQEATNGAEGIQLISNSSQTPDVVLLDINMPLMNGYEFLDTYAQRSVVPDSEPDIYILSTVTNKLPPMAQKMIKGHFEKPLTAQHIKQILASMGVSDAN